MKQTRFATRALLLFLVTMLLTGTVALSTLAADRTYPYEKAYGQIVPTDSKLSAPKGSYSFYGDKATLYFMRISNGQKNAHYAIEICKDKKYTDPILSYSDDFDSVANNKALSITWNFKSTPSGTYYGRAYAYVERSDGIVIDSDSVRTFTVKINRVGKKVVELKSVANAANGIKLTWTPLTTGTKYNVYRKAAGETKWTKLTSLGKGSSSFTDKTAKSGKKYTYTVKGFDGKYESLYNKTGLSITYLSTPTLSKAGSSGSAGYAKIAWSKVSGAKGYYVYRKGGSLNNYNWEKIATIKSGSTVSYIDKTAKSSDWNYTYTVKAFNGKTVSSYNKTGVDYNFIKAPVLKSASPYKNGVKITWADSSSVTAYYYVYRKTSNGWEKIGKTTENYFVDTNAKSGKTYTYTVKACAKTNTGGHNPTGISSKFLSTPVLKSVSFDASQRAKITWSKVSGAQGYRVYRKVTGEKAWTHLADIKGGSTLSYLDTVKKASGTTYTYTVRAFYGKTFSYYDTKGIANMFLSTPSVTLKNKTSQENPVGVNISWKAVKGAAYYHVYRRNTGDSKWEIIASKVTDLSFYDTTAVSGTAYDYTVRTFNGNSSSKYTVYKTIALERPIISDAVLTAEGIQLNWNEILGADTYYVYRKAPDETKWTAIGSYSMNSYLDTSEEAKTNAYVYTIVAESKGYRSDYNKEGTKNFASIKNLTATFTPAGESDVAFITLDWAYNGDYDYIEIYKSTAGEDRVLIATFTNDEQTIQLVDNDLAIGTEYVYTVKTVKDGKVPTETSANAKYPHAPVEAVNFETTAVFDEEGSYINIVFTPVEFAESYEVYKRSSKEQEWIKITDFVAADINTETVTYTDYDVEEEAIYYYTVKGIASDRESLYNESGLWAVVCRPLPAVAGIIVTQAIILEGDVEKQVAKITWDPVENKNLQYYKILRKTNGGEWEIIDFTDILDPTINCYNDKTIEQGIEYTYTVVACATGRDSLINETGVDFCWPADAPEATPEETPEENTNT